MLFDQYYESEAVTQEVLNNALLTETISLISGTHFNDFANCQTSRSNLRRSRLLFQEVITDLEKRGANQVHSEDVEIHKVRLKDIKSKTSSIDRVLQQAVELFLDTQQVAKKEQTFDRSRSPILFFMDHTVPDACIERWNKHLNHGCQWNWVKAIERPIGHLVYALCCPSRNAVILWILALVTGLICLIYLVK